MYYLGIDIAKHNHVAALIDNNGKVIAKNIKFTNDSQGYEKLISSLQISLNIDKHSLLSNISIAMEATGHYWLSLFSALEEDGFNISVYNPFQIKSFRGAYYNRNQKTDVIDALIIANYIRTFGSKNTTLPDDSLLSLKQLTRYRADLIKNISSTKNQVIAILDKVFPEFSSLFSDTFGKTAKAILSVAPIPNDIVSLGSNKLLDLVSTSSKARFKQDFVDKLTLSAKNSFGIKLTNKACAFELKQLINTIIFIEEQISELDVEINSIYNSLDTYLTSIPGIGDILAPIQIIWAVLREQRPYRPY